MVEPLNMVKGRIAGYGVNGPRKVFFFQTFSKKFLFFILSFQKEKQNKIFLFFIYFYIFFVFMKKFEEKMKQKYIF